MNTIEPRGKCGGLSWLVAAALLVALARSLSAQTVAQAPAGATPADRALLLPESSDRTHGREFSILLREFTSPNLTVLNIDVPGTGTYDGVVRFKNRMTYGCSLGYSLSDRINLNANLSYGHPQYTGTWGSDSLTGEGTLWNGNLNAEYYILKGHLTPFVSAGIGGMYFKSNVPDGDPANYPWWSVWWTGGGPISSDPSHHEFNLTWNAAAGVRWDAGESLFLRAGYQLIWSKLGASGRSAFPQYWLSAGWRW